MPDFIAPTQGHRAPIRELLRWYRPYLRGSGRALTWTLTATVVMLACQTVVPLKVESILHHATWDTLAVIVLIALVLTQLGAGHLAHLTAHEVANRSGFRLATRLFDQTMWTRVMRRGGMTRSSVVSRHTSDVDVIMSAAEDTLASGIPGIARIVIGLSMLVVIDWRSGLAMIGATTVFLIVRQVIGKRMIIADHERVHAASMVGEIVDEAITADRLVSGLGLNGWMSRRFLHRSHVLEHATHIQGKRVTQLITGSHAAALAGLLFVTIFALVAGGASLAGVVASLLYVEAVVQGIEALPPWVRSLQLAIVSRNRIDQILDDLNAPPAPPGSMEGIDIARLVTIVDDTAAGQLVGLVTAPGIEPDPILSAISTLADPEGWRITLSGYDVRAAGIGPGIVHVADDPVAFNATPLEHLQALAPSLTASEAMSLLDAVGLGSLAHDESWLHEDLGPTGTHLTASDRQRLALAMALAARPRVLLVAPLLALGDVDTATPLLSTLRNTDAEHTVVAAQSPDVAAQMDRMIFVTERGILVGTHAELLVASPAYADMWERRLRVENVDLSVLGIEAESDASLYTRLVTERFAPGDAIYREGDAADRIVFIVSGRVEVTTTGPGGESHRVAVLGPGNHCGDLRLSVGERRAENAIAIEDCVARTLSRDAISAGVIGTLDRTVTERRILTTIMRDGPTRREDIRAALADVDDAAFTNAVALLVRDGALTDEEGELQVVHRRSTKSGAASLLDRLSDA